VRNSKYLGYVIIQKDLKDSDDGARPHNYWGSGFVRHRD
jgi:hypothetical protein